MLQKNEIWLPRNTTEYTDLNTSNASSSLATTVTLVENNNEPVIITTPENNTITEISTNYPLVDLESSTKYNNKATNETLFLSETLNKMPSSTAPTNASYNVKENLSEDVWRRFQVPWSRLSQSYLNMIKEGKRFKDRYTEIIRICIDELRMVSTSIPYVVYKRVAYKIVEQYPQTFLDTDDDGVVLGDGTFTLVKKMIDRNNYLNKPHKRQLDITDSTSCGQKKKLLATKAGCSYWQPVRSKETEETVQNKIKILNETDIVDIENIESLLEDTYCSQRTFINKEEVPGIKDIKENWPVLLNPKVIEWHFQKLTKFFLGDLESNLKKKCKRIMDYGKIKNVSNVDDAVMSETDKCIEALTIVARLLNEKIDVLLHKLSVSTLKVIFDKN